jgi:hypothetical protein
MNMRICLEQGQNRVNTSSIHKLLLWCKGKSGNNIEWLKQVTDWSQISSRCSCVVETGHGYGTRFGISTKWMAEIVLLSLKSLPRKVCWDMAGRHFSHRSGKSRCSRIIRTWKLLMSGPWLATVRNCTFISLMMKTRNIWKKPAAT